MLTLKRRYANKQVLTLKAKSSEKLLATPVVLKLGSAILLGFAKQFPATAKHILKKSKQRS